MFADNFFCRSKDFFVPNPTKLWAEKPKYTLFFFFYKNKLYKNTQAEICPKIKNKLKTITRLKFWSEKSKKLI